MDSLAILRSYYLGKRPFYGKKTVIPGLYYISCPVHSTNEREFLVRAFWHPTEPTFLSQPSFIINLSPLRNWDSISIYKVLPLEQLINSIIKIDEVNLIDTTFKGLPCKAYKVRWE